MKLITFTVPCYNSAAYMDRCVETLLPAGEDEDITNETELRKTDTRDETLQQMQQRQKEALRRFSETLGENNYEKRKSFFKKK